MYQSQGLFKKGIKLVKLESPYPPNLWRILSRKVIIYGLKSDVICKTKSGDYFGDKAILNPVEISVNI